MCEEELKQLNRRRKKTKAAKIIRTRDSDGQFTEDIQMANRKKSVSNPNH